MASAPKVLIVDDDPEFLRMMLRFFQRGSRFECLSATDGAQALKLCREKHPDAIVLDLRLGGRLNGFDVMRFLKADPLTSFIEIVLMTGEAKKADDLLKSASAGMGSHVLLRKPFNLPDLAEAITDALAKRARATEPNVIARGPLTIDLKRRRAFAMGQELSLGYRSFDVLCVLAENPQGLSQNEIRDRVWKCGGRADNIVRVTIHRLRAHLAQACGQEVILTAPGGYKLRGA